LKERFALWMILGSLGLWGLGCVLWGPDFVRSGFLGMIAPLVMGVITVAFASRKYKDTPEKLTGLMISMFGLKMVFYAIYVVIVFKTAQINELIFVLSFSVFFILLHLAEALYFRAKFIAS